MKKTYEIMHKISGWISKVLFVLIFLVVVANLGSVILQVINRYIIVKISNISLSFTEELSRISMIWCCYLCIPICYREGSMAQLDLLYDRVGGKGKFVLYILSRVLVIGFIIVVFYYGKGVILAKKAFLSSMLRIPGIYLYSAPLFGCGITLYEVITELVGVFAGVLTPFEAGKHRNFPEHEEPMEELEV